MPGPPPAVNLALLRSGKRILALGLVAITSSVLYSVLFIAPILLQQVQRHSATDRGPGTVATGGSHGSGQRTR